MARVIAILEDNEDRQAAMADCLRDRFPQYPVRFFATAPEMIWYLRRHLPDVLAIALDHDLELIPGADPALFDPGSGRDVANYLASEQPCCPIIINSTNTDAVNEY